ncbi:hypothetical protein DPMN_103602 [Dreissena polymorpha]|uniref:Uncharacterized protein n=1 Tax=Dreissena polymorpha TaxID=45954 RepID=A0A9D4JZB9_DREPO|nr:hypothetical protein DPMN_103602 [Dreissena polymorpha]
MCIYPGKTTNEPSGGTPLHPGYRSTITSLSCGIVLNDADKDLLDQPNKDQERIEGFWPFAEGLRKYAISHDFAKTRHTNSSNILPWAKGP